MSLKGSVEVLITDFEKKGKGLGYFLLPNGNRQEAIVPFTVPGDHIIARLIRKRSGVYEASLEQILRSSPDRIAAKCVHFASCGGCVWQQIPYEQQLKIKENQILHSLSPFKIERTEWHSIIPCENPWQYRNKMEYSFSMDAKGNRYLGLVIAGSKGKVLNLEECHLVSPWFIETLKKVQKWWEERQLSAYFPPKDKGSLQTLTLREGIHTGDHMIILTVSGNPNDALKNSDLKSFVAATQDRTSIYLRIRQSIRGKAVQFYEIHLEGPESIQEKMVVDGHTLYFQISPQAFFQPNTKQAEKLYQKAIEFAKIPKGGRVLDLYCGTATLGISASKRAKEVIGIELSPESVLDARENAKRNGCENVQINQGDVGDVLANMVLGKFDAVFVDPPRSGLDQKAIQHLLAIRAHKIVYISCNPTTQAENIKQLILNGYELSIVQPVDQFPQTYHIENIAVLTKPILEYSA